jgi:hypothetical protein
MQSTDRQGDPSVDFTAARTPQTRRSRRRRRPDDEDVELVCIVPGDYTVVYAGHIGVEVFRTRKVRVDFIPLDHPGLTLSRWYRVKDYRGGRIQAGRSSDIVRELSAAMGRRLRHDRIPVSELEGKQLLARVRTVGADARQEELADCNRYSVIEKLLKVL